MDTSEAYLVKPKKSETQKIFEGEIELGDNQFTDILCEDDLDSFFRDKQTDEILILDGYSKNIQKPEFEFFKNFK